MPELPEVETIARSLDDVLRSKTIKEVKFFRDSLREKIPTLKVKEVLEGEKVEEVFRRAKYIIIKTKKGLVFSHLGMTGNFLNTKDLSPQKKHTHLIISYKINKSKVQALHYIDPRRFGRLTAQSSLSWQKHPWFIKNGSEPLEKKELGKYLHQMSKNKKVPIKNFLMKPEVLVGVGNIYACEALFLSQVKPSRPCENISLSTWKTLAQNIKKVLKQAIKAGGTSIKDFRRLEDEKGYFKQSLFVYGRENKNCYTCKTNIQRIVQAGRSSWFCPNCQV